MYMLLDSSWPNQQRQTFGHPCYKCGFPKNLVKSVNMKIPKAPCSPLLIHSILVSIHDFSEHSPSILQWGPKWGSNVK